MALASSLFEKYGRRWNEGTHPIAIEFWMIQQGEKWLKQQGRSLFFHYRQCFQILWPDDDNHRWSDLILKSYCEHEISTILGSSDASKTHTMSKIVLVDYWCFPTQTLWLVSTTEGRGAELRFWGSIKDLFNSARSRMPDLPGHPLDHMKTITTGEIDENDEGLARSLRAGIIVVPCKSGGMGSALGAFIGIKSPRLRHAGDECFPAGTMVDTPAGQQPIEQIQPGDKVLSAIGESYVRATIKHQARNLVRVTAKDGRVIHCTPDHPFFTNFGWVKACELNQNHYAISNAEAMRMLRGNDYGKNERKALSVVQERPKSMSALQKGIRKPAIRKTEVLQQELSGVMASTTAGIQKKGFHKISGCKTERVTQKTVGGKSNPEKTNIIQNSGVSSVLESVLSKDSIKDLRFLPFNSKDVRFMQSAVPSEEIPKSAAVLRRMLQEEVELEFANTGRTVLNFNDAGISLELSSQNREKKHMASGLLDRCSTSKNLVGSRSGWVISPVSDWKEAGLKEGGVSEGSWVDRVEILESGNIGRAITGEKEVAVYNLSVVGHPSYSVSGLLVHNCQVMNESFLSAYSNWYGKEGDGFKGMIAGNFMETDDPLGVASEPIDGWDSWTDTGKTQEWESRFYGAHVIALDGRDSPNFDFDNHETEPPHYRYLIGHKKLDMIAKTKGTDSWEWYSQCVGKPVKGMDIWRVITKGFCERHHALDEAVWRGTDGRQFLYALDPAYGLGDRCVGRLGEMGPVSDGAQILRVGPPEVIPIKITGALDAEEQIALFIKGRLDELGVPYRSCFYDSFGRGTLGFQFARIMGSDTPIPIDSGARPTTRPVRFDLFIEDGNERRLKRCDEHYTKFVSEMWFSVREAIESEQMRNLDMETIREGQTRKFTKNAQAKIEVESKDEMKKRLGKSPDFFDNVGILVEGARRLGFQIRRIGAELTQGKEDDFLAREQASYQEAMQSKMLTHR